MRAMFFIYTYMYPYICIYVCVYKNLYNPHREDLGYCIVMQSLVSLSNLLVCFLVYRWKITILFLFLVLSYWDNAVCPKATRG